MYTRSAAIEMAAWSLDLVMDFNPSSANFTRIYLAADYPVPGQVQNALYLECGGSEDRISLWLMENGATQIVLHSTNALLDTASVHIGIRINTTGDSLCLVVDQSSAGRGIQKWCTGNPPSIGAQYFVVQCVYTRTRARKFYFDALQCSGLPESTPPQIDTVRTDSLTRVILDFSESMDTLSVWPDMFAFNNRHPGSIRWNNTRQPVLHFSPGFSQGEQGVLTIAGPRDLRGNMLPDTGIALSWVYARPPRTGELIITEIMADPSPSYGLPETEYVEVLNRSNHVVATDSLAINNYALSGPQFLMPGTTMLLLPESVDFPSIDSAPLMRWEGKSTLLNNTGDAVIISGPSGVIDRIDYLSRWHTEPYAQSGGIALVLTDTGLTCRNHGRYWRSSPMPGGGSPGRTDSRSVAWKHPPPKPVIPTWNPWEKVWTVKFNQPIDDSLCFLDCNGDTVLLSPYPWQSHRLPLPSGTTTGVCLLQAKACNTGEQGAWSVPLATPVFPGKGDLVLNEILFDANITAEYVELRNTANISLRLDQVQINADGIAPLPATVGGEIPVALPNSLILLSNDTMKMPEQYPRMDPNRWLPGFALPALPDNGGTLSLWQRDTLLDRAPFDAAMHHNTLVRTTGAALERIAPSNSGRTAWISAAATTNYGTPGSPNSQTPADHHSSAKLHLSTQLITPDLDGYNDFLVISLSMPSPGNALTLSIFNDRGLWIRDLVRNQIAGPDDQFIWHARDASGNRVSSGAYILVTEITDSSGKTSRLRKVVHVQ